VDRGPPPHREEGELLEQLAPPPRLALRPDGSRALVVISDGVDLGEALRQAVPREMVIVRSCRPGEAAGVIESCLPFPWMIAGDVADAPEVVALSRRRPVLLAWRGVAPAGAPAHARSFATFAALARFVQRALSASVGGMRLGRGAGVDLASGGVLRAAALEPLIALHPGGIDLPPGVFRSAANALARRHVPWRPAYVSSAGGVVLVPHVDRARA
jgi:hypothetical protein